MIDSVFEPNVPGWYEVQNVAETEWDKDQYGNVWYSVKFTADAKSHLWLAKEEPEEGKKYYGHFELTKSGKAYRFKRDKEPEDAERPAGANKAKTDSSAYLKDLSSMPLDVLRTVMPYIDAQALVKNDKAYYGEVMTLVTDLSNDLLLMSDNIRNGDKKAVEPEKTWEQDAKDEVDA